MKFCGNQYEKVVSVRVYHLVQRRTYKENQAIFRDVANYISKTAGAIPFKFGM